MTDKETMKQALEALENLFGIPDKWTGEGGGDVAVWRLGGSYRAQQAITALKEALAQPEQTEVQQLIALVRAQQITIDKLEAALAQSEQEPVEYCTAYYCAGDCGQPHNQEEMQEFLRAQPAPVQEIDWKDMYEKEKRRSEMWISKYEKDIGPLEKAGPVAAQPEQEPDYNICPTCGGMASDPIVPFEQRQPAPVQEPVAFKIYLPKAPRQDVNHGLLPWVYDQDPSSGNVASMWVTPVKTTPPQRTWVGLTDEEVESCWRQVQANDFHDCVQHFARDIEAKLKAKNFA